MRWIFVRNAVNFAVNFCKKCGKCGEIFVVTAFTAITAFPTEVHHIHRISCKNLPKNLDPGLKCSEPFLGSVVIYLCKLTRKHSISFDNNPVAKKCVRVPRFEPSKMNNKKMTKLNRVERDSFIEMFLFCVFAEIFVLSWVAASLVQPLWRNVEVVLKIFNLQICFAALFMFIYPDCFCIKWN